ncbi:hypothetical protein KPS_003430 [Nitratidesulfovibrio liaohensis]|uniref:UPF0313 domain-containing protein n=1 Tax=Nitratidesulfovibrio liaohensis TaxID=2604158 RepID=A0ABY9R7R2_9BACT|nr:hypothetical protein [Nitratidesulfovibrio liaohensis]WMW67351.1 hypothetical protein KPS_003430 [Nitratidesulfovibrio liaohensis]
MRDLGWDRLDVLLVSGDAYVDHPTFAMALLGRWLVAHGFRTGIVAQPRWDIPDDVARMGRPRLFTGISAGSLDSMLAHYTAFRKKRHDDAFTPGGRAGARPNRAAIVYANLARQAFSGLPVVLGGIEASLRRISHYDFWTNALRRPILMDAKADLLVWGMGERALLDAACALDAAVEAVGADAYDAALLPPLAEIFDGIPGTARMGRMAEWDTTPAEDAVGRAGDKLDADDRNDNGLEDDHVAPGTIPLMRLPSHAAIMADPRLLMRATLLLERHVHRGDARAIQPVDDTATSRAVLLAPPAPPLSPDEMDALYALPFARRAHPAHREPVPAEEMIRTSITTHRGCGGGCSFCSLALHQGRRIASRSRDSVLDEARRLNDMERFNGSVSDVGGPSANMWKARCTLGPGPLPPGKLHASARVPRLCRGPVRGRGTAARGARHPRRAPRARGQRGALRPCPARRGRPARLHHGVHRRPVEGGPGTHLRQRAGPDAQARPGRVRTVPDRLRRPFHGGGQGTVRGPLPAQRLSRLHRRRHAHPVPLAGGARLVAPAGAVLHPHPRHRGHGHVLRGHRPCGQPRARGPHRRRAAAPAPHPDTRLRPAARCGWPCAGRTGEQAGRKIRG